MVKRFVCSLSSVLVAMALAAAAAVAVTPAARLTVESGAVPSNFAVGDNAKCEQASEQEREGLCDAYEVVVRDRGSVATDGSPITITDALPAGLTVQKIRFYWSGLAQETEDLGSLCEPVAVQCEFPLALRPDETLRMIVLVTVAPGAAADLTNAASVSGGGVAGASTSVRSTNGPVPPLFGVRAFGLDPFGSDGAPDTQAGGHPYELGTTIDLNNVRRRPPEGEGIPNTSVHDLRDVVVDLPLGLVGSALSAPTCTLAQLASLLPVEEGGLLDPVGCPAQDTRVGHIVTSPATATVQVNTGVFNVVPEHGVAAEFGSPTSSMGPM